MNNGPRLSVTMITHNEERNLPRALDSVSCWADEIVIVDAFSSDKTEEIARRYEASFYQRTFDDFSNQKNFAVEKAIGEWILSLDADEVVDPVLTSSIQEAIRNPRPRADGFWMKRKNYLFGRELRFGGEGRDKQLRLFRKGSGGFTGRVHERIQIEGETGVLKGHLFHYSTNNLEEYLRKLALYTRFEGDRLRRMGRGKAFLNLCLRPPLRFALNYVLKGGFLDGREGLLYHLLSSYYDFVKYARAIRDSAQ